MKTKHTLSFLLISPLLFFFTVQASAKEAPVLKGELSRYILHSKPLPNAPELQLKSGEVVVEKSSIVLNLKWIVDGEEVPSVSESATRSEEQNNCGSKVYLAQSDRRALDGPLMEIKVYDNRQRHCRDLRSPVEVFVKKTFTSFSGETSKTNYVLKGDNIID